MAHWNTPPRRSGRQKLPPTITNLPRDPAARRGPLGVSTIAARYGAAPCEPWDTVKFPAGQRAADDLALLPRELIEAVAFEPPRTLARLEKVAQRIRRHATQSGKPRPTPTESREVAARLHGYDSFAAAADRLAG